MKLEEIEAEYDKDSAIDDTQLGYEATKTSSLWQKYRKIYNQEVLLSANLKARIDIMRAEKEIYFLGRKNSDKEWLTERGLEPYPMVVTKEGAMRLVESDEDYIKLALKISYQLEKIQYLKDILSFLNSRSFLIASAIKDQIWKNGGE
jgi:hypothetical protein